MCGGFTCSKNALTTLNILYVVVAFILIGVAVYGKASALGTNIPVISGILACGVFLILISILGLIGAAKHHQVILFFYMIILFFLFLVQFSIACACLTVNSDQQEKLARQGWESSSIEFKEQIQETFQCCGFDNRTNSKSANSLSSLCKSEFCCCKPNNDSSLASSNCSYPYCIDKLKSTISYSFKLAGGIGLFFSFTEVLAVVITYQYRNLHDPLEKRPAAIIPRNYLY
ncbi:tetraspanin-31 A, putative [Pediculus humanus corporis]|uniref:Tetraspanin-31 A, putative n=1 Tax=Pediculus humanus subsp. corporis TaxID=121224 RepID=E0VD20_PEDHC|nr:tetraspanin-31 A, putative [Pediculus humanus corporis]EEB11276.1 tetraspanin-31 A, putative [Pediculus humanus corporis]